MPKALIVNDKSADNCDIFPKECHCDSWVCMYMLTTSQMDLPLAQLCTCLLKIRAFFFSFNTSYFMHPQLVFYNFHQNILGTWYQSISPQETIV